jgi:hypothetical protein
VLRNLEPDERRALAEFQPRPIQAGPVPDDDIIALLTDGMDISPIQRQRDRLTTLTRGFIRRKSLLADALRTSQVAGLLGTSRQTPLDRLKSGTLLGLRDHGDWRFPAWQFDPGGPDGVLAGLQEVLAALPGTAFAKASWLTTPHPALGQSPVEALRAGHLQRVLAEARAVGAA